MKLPRKDLLEIVYMSLAVFGCVLIGCTVKPDAAKLDRPLPGSSVNSVGSAAHPRIKIKAQGLTPATLKQWLPQLANAIRGDYVQAVPGVEAQLSDIDVTINQLSDGRILVDLGPAGQRIRIDKTVLGFLKVSGTEVIDNVVMDDAGVDVHLRGSLISGVRLLPMEEAE